MLGVALVLSVAVLLVVLSAGAAPPAGISALSCSSSSSPCVLAPGGAAQTVTFANLNGRSTTALTVALARSPSTAAFAIVSNSCSGVALGPRKTCQVSVEYTQAAPAQAQTATVTVATKKTPIQSASAYFAVAAANHAPVANDDGPYTIQSVDHSGDVGAPGVLANDTDADGDALTAVLVSNAAHGTVTLHSDGSFHYAGTAYIGSDSFTYKANDGQADSNVATVSLNVEPCCPTPEPPTPTATP